MLLVFLVSALLHEYIIAFAIFRPTWYAFAGMWANALIIIVEKPFLKALKLEGSNIGNVSFWFNFCVVGQPMMIILYYIYIMNMK